MPNLKRRPRWQQVVTAWTESYRSKKIREIEGGVGRNVGGSVVWAVGGEFHPARFSGGLVLEKQIITKNDPAGGS